MQCWVPRLMVFKECGLQYWFRSQYKFFPRNIRWGYLFSFINSFWDFKDRKMSHFFNRNCRHDQSENSRCISVGFSRTAFHAIFITLYLLYIYCYSHTAIQEGRKHSFSDSRHKIMWNVWWEVFLRLTEKWLMIHRLVLIRLKNSF